MSLLQQRSPGNTVYRNNHCFLHESYETFDKFCPKCTAF